jgi:hypothetical protein
VAEQTLPDGRAPAHTCTAADPWAPGKGTPALHPDAETLADRDFGGGEYCEKYRCPHCGLTFYVELPQ